MITDKEVAEADEEIRQLFGLDPGLPITTEWLCNRLVGNISAALRANLQTAYGGHNTNRKRYQPCVAAEALDDEFEALHF